MQLLKKPGEIAGAGRASKQFIPEAWNGYSGGYSISASSVPKLMDTGDTMREKNMTIQMFKNPPDPPVTLQAITLAITSRGSSYHNGCFQLVLKGQVSMSCANGAIGGRVDFKSIEDS